MKSFLADGCSEVLATVFLDLTVPGSGVALETLRGVEGGLCGVEEQVGVQLVHHVLSSAIHQLASELAVAEDVDVVEVRDEELHWHLREFLQRWLEAHGEEEAAEGVSLEHAGLVLDVRHGAVVPPTALEGVA